MKKELKQEMEKIEGYKGRRKEEMLWGRVQEHNVCLVRRGS